MAKKNEYPEWIQNGISLLLKDPAYFRGEQVETFDIKGKTFKLGNDRKTYLVRKLTKGYSVKEVKPNPISKEIPAKKAATKKETAAQFKKRVHQETMAENVVRSKITDANREVQLKKSQQKKESDWKKSALADLKKYADNDRLKIERTEGAHEFIASDGDEEYRVFRDFEEAQETAVGQVENMIDDEPELFSQSFLEDHIMVRPGDINIIAGEEADNATANEELEEGDKGYDKLHNKVRKEWSDGLRTNAYRFLRDRGIYDDAAQLMKLPWIAIDSGEAAKAAVNEDGVAHFMSPYDGKEVDLADGAVAYRTN